ncbi:MAG: PA14 domain-containing protein [Anaerolineae bacterium]
MRLYHLMIKIWVILAITSIWSTFIIGQVYAQGSSGTNPQCPIPPQSILVYLNSFYNEWPSGSSRYQTPAFENYVWGVVMGELGTVVPQGPYQGQAWDDEVLRAQAVAARTWGAYWCRKRTLPDGRRGVYDGAGDQVYRPYYAGFPLATKIRYQNVSLETKGVYISWDGLLLQSPYNGVLLDAQYRRDVGNPSMTTSEQQTWSAYQYLKSVNNPYNVNNIDDGVGWGQLPSQGWRNTPAQGAGYPQLLHQYYTGIYLQNQGYITFTERFWNNTSCSGTPAWQGNSNSINYDWSTGSPRSGVNSDYFCAEWQANVPFDASDWYTFYLIVDDGVRLYVDGVLVLDRWVVQAPTIYSISLYLTSGSHSIRMRYYENTGLAVARLSWLRGIGMIGEYYDSIINRTGDPGAPVIMLRPDVPIRFDWHVYSPLDTRQQGVPRIYEDTFSARWQGRIYIDQCRWINFRVRSDDGIILKIFHDPYGGGEEVLIDQWRDQPPTNYNYWRWLCPGTYRLEARYYENGGGAVINIWWER